MRLLPVWPFIFACALLGSSFAPTVQAQTISACYEGRCYPSLSAAEAVLRTDPVYGRLYRRKESFPKENSQGTRIYYGIPDQPAETTFDPAYLMAGWGVQKLGCRASEMFPGHCADENELISLFTTEYKSGFASGLCTIRSEKIAGAYGEPFIHVNGGSAPPGASGVMALAWEKLGKYWELEFHCNEWPTQESDFYQAYLSKAVAFKCPAGFWARTGYSQAYLPDGSPSETVDLQTLCRASEQFKYIDVTTAQVCSVGTAHPCHPATGDKSRAEPDFEFAGKTFVRYYHSLGQFKGQSGSAPGWSHTYEERLNLNYTLPTQFSAQGYFVGFVALGGSRHRDDGGRILERGTDGIYRLTDASGTVKAFDDAGKLVSIKHASDPSADVTLLYEAGLLLAIVDAKGRVVEFTYANGLYSKISLPDGRVISYGYDADSNLVSVDYGNGEVKRYHYHESGLASSVQSNHLTGITSEDGVRYASFGYDQIDRVISSRLHADAGYVAQASLDYQSDTSVVVSEEGRGTRTYTVQPGLYRRVLSVADSNGATNTTYRADGRVDAVVAPNNVRTAYEYVDSYRSAVVAAVGTSVERREVTQRDAANRVTRLETWGKVNGVQTLSRIDLIAYDANGRPKASCSVDPLVSRALKYVCGSAVHAPAGVRQTTRSYCEQSGIDAGTCPILGLVTRVDGPRTDVSDTSSYTYYPSDEPTCATSPATCQHRKGDLWKVTNALSQVMEALSYDGSGRILAVKDVNGVVSDMEYHPRGWLTAIKVRGTDPGSEADDLITRIDYEPTGLIRQIALADGGATRFTYDPAQRLTDIVDGEGNRIHYTLDNAGNRIKEDIVASNGSVQRTLSRVYDQLGQLKTSIDAYDHGTGFIYDTAGNTNTITDALSKVADNDYDPLNRLTQTIRDLGGINSTIKFEYDAGGNRTAIIDPKQLATRYAYNGLGDLTKLTSPDSGITSYTYDSAGNRKSETDARLKLTTFGYDAANRLTTTGFATSALNIVYSYDLSNTVCLAGENFPKGHLTQLKDGSGTTQYCYDRFGLLTRKVQTINGKVFTQRYAYAKAGQLAGVTYPDGTVVDYQRDTHGRASAVGVTLPGGVRQVLLQEATYYPFGPAAEWVFGNGRLFQRTLNRNYQPGVVQDAFPGGLSLGYEFDEVGNLRTLRNGNQNDPPQRLFGYDALNRLTGTREGATGTLLQAYTYDATGNRQSATVGAITTPYTTETTSHRLSKVGAVTRGYDAAGSAISIGGTAREFLYDSAGRMSQAKQNSAVTMNYLYNGKGEQVRRYLGTANTYTVYDESGNWLGEYDTAGAPIQQAIWLDGLPVGLIAGGKLQYIEADHMGTPRVVIDPQRDVAVWQWDLAGEAFGNSAPNQDPDGDATAFSFTLRFPGQRYDAASGMNYNYLRDGYETATGRYTQSDPIGLFGGIATYTYVGGSPLTHVDPLGLLRFAPWVEKQYPRTVKHINSLLSRMNERKYEGFYKFANIGKDDLDKLLDSCSGPVVNPKAMDVYGTYKPGSGVIDINLGYFIDFESGSDISRSLDATVEHELVHFAEHFWNQDRSNFEEGKLYEAYIYGGFVK